MSPSMSPLLSLGRILLPIFLVLPGLVLSQSQQEEAEDYFEKWLKEDVVYTITEEEKDVFNQLQTIQEKERFIEQFWFRRDPDPRTAYNEYKEEHYRRIKYANERFTSGIPGWKTDRGMIYIKYGEPDRIESRPSGGHYQRPSWEGGGSTSTYPFERWEYRYLAGVGQDIEIEFVDRTLTGEYRMTTNAWDKDALLLVPGAGQTDAEAMGLANRVDRVRPLTNPMPGSNPLLIGYGRAKDQPFEKLATFTNLHRPPKVDFSDFRRPDVLTNIRYELLPFEVGVDYLAIDEKNYLVPITVVVPNQHLDYVADGTRRMAFVGVYGQVSTLSGQILKVFEETISTEMDTEPSQNARQNAYYQKSLQLPPGRYKLDVILQDEHSEKVGRRSKGIILPQLKKDQFVVSSVVLAESIRMLDQEDVSAMNPFGPVKVFPNISHLYRPNQPLLALYQLSNFAVDPTSRSGYLSSSAEIRRGSERITSEQLTIDDTVAQNRERLHLIHQFDLADLEPGSYELVLRVKDHISDQQLERRIPFQIASDN